MSEIQKLSWEQINNRAEEIAKKIKKQTDCPAIKLYGVPRGGIFAALKVLTNLSSYASIVETPDEADIIIDDIVDSGNTRHRHNSLYGMKPFYALVDKTGKDSNLRGAWISFPWERMGEAQEGPVDNVTRLIEYIGDDPNREGLKETPQRVVRSYETLFGGYKQNPEEIIKVFEDGSCNEMVLLRDVEFYSQCLVGSTFIDTPTGRIPINKLQDGTFVYCWDEDKCSMTIARCVNPRITGKNKRLYRVYTDKDTILCTGNHRFLTHNRNWVQAKHLTTGDSVVALNKGTIVQTGGIARAYVVWTGMRRQIPEHRFIYESINGAVGDKHIHHIDGNPNNNTPENLTALSNSKHSILHRLQDPTTGFALFTDEQRQKMKQKQIEGIRKSQTEEVRKKRAASVKAYWDSLTPKQRSNRNHRVLSVERTNWFEDVWCMDVPGYENFVANGMVVHNCEHHMLPFFGYAHIAYIPDGRVIGVSKLARILEIYTRRLQIQERISEQVTECLMTHLKPKGAACVLQAQHLCMVCRGVEKQNAKMVTSSLKGVFLEDPRTRNEFFSMIGK